jgi:ribonucleotide monophosphatase NagD (HAD superfamily)
MACFFVDLDGTLVDFGTSDPLPGAVDILLNLVNEGHQVVFTTYRPGPSSDIMDLLKTITAQPVVLWNIQSPRVVINDDGAYAIDHESGASWFQYARAFARLPVM